MVDLLKKVMLAGLGAFAITKEKAEEIVDELIKKGELTEDKRLKTVQDLLDKAREQEDALNAKVAATVKNVLEKLDLPTRKDIARLEKKIDQLIR
ncbi:MAG: phasin family protein [Fidelibacterota bacterium]